MYSSQKEKKWPVIKWKKSHVRGRFINKYEKEKKYLLARSRYTTLVKKIVLYIKLIYLKIMTLDVVPKVLYVCCMLLKITTITLHPRVGYHVLQIKESTWGPGNSCFLHTTLTSKKAFSCSVSSLLWYHYFGVLSICKIDFDLEFPVQRVNNFIFKKFKCNKKWVRYFEIASMKCQLCL